MRSSSKSGRAKRFSPDEGYRLSICRSIVEAHAGRLWATVCGSLGALAPRGVQQVIDEASEVQIYLDAHPEIAARIATFSRQREALRAAAAPTFETCRWTLRMSVYRGRPEV